MSAALNASPYQEPGKVPSIVLALVVHLLLATFLFFGVRWQSRQPDTVMVELWNSTPAPAVESAVAKPEPAPAPKPVSKPEIKAEPKPEPKVEKTVEPPKPDIALEKKKEVKKEPPAKPEPKLDLDRSKDIRAQADREMSDLGTKLEKESILDQMRRDAATASARADAAYIGKLKGKIKSNIVLPPDIPGNPEAIFDVVQLPTGEVMSVKLRKSSAHKAYDAAVERAILKSSPLPKPERPEQFQRDLEIRFRPLE